ncbi:MAG: hypothetical protein AB1486_19430 [Planctomycetota bacterium]
MRWLKSRFLLTILAVIALALPATAQLGLDIQGGGVGQTITFTLTGPPGGQYLNILSLSTGPTCLPPPHNICLDVDLLLLGLSLSIPGFYDYYPPSGVQVLTYPIPSDPIFGTLPPINFQTILIGPPILDKSNLYRVTFAMPGTFAFTIEPLLEARAMVRLAELDDFSVLAIGGGLGDLTSGTGLATCEVYSRNLEKFSSAPSMNVPRALHTATRLLDGRILVTGGVNAFGVPVSSAEIYDPAGPGWTLTSAMARARAGHAASLLPDGRVLISGGSADFSDAYQFIVTSTETTEIFNPATLSFTAGPNLAEPKVGHSSTALLTGNAIVAGGYSFFLLFGIPVPQISDQAQLYNYSPGGAGSFGSERTMRAGRLAHSATLLGDGRVLLVAGAGGSNPLDPIALSSAELYDPGSNGFSNTGSLTGARATHSGTLLPDGKVLVAGGIVGSITAPVSIDTAEVWNPATGTFHAVGNLNTTRSTHDAILLADGTVLLVGGAGGPSESSLDTAEAYQPE